VLPGGQRLAIGRVPNTPRATDAVRLLIRPEDVCVHPAQAAAPNTLAGTITFVRDVGASIEATIDCRGFTLTAATTPRETPDLHVGMPVAAELPAHACKLIAARGA
ncbi:TOBE domain-containing protein, partial [Burkholderia pseudomallei]|uniref:TOBE domain-containing protein n=1 Tax=Burkholderia pseudomallei TaxID=28450 RepID=UPI0021F7F650